MGEAFISRRGGSGDGTGGKLIVTAPAGATVTVSKDGKTKTRVASAEGVAVFQGLTTGEWTVTITDGTQTATKTVTVTADYSTDITFFSATINVTYPEGSVCTATDGVTTLTAPDTSGTWACVVPNAGTWTVSCTDGTDRDSAAVEITEDGQSASVSLQYILILYKDGYLNSDITGGNFIVSDCILSENGVFYSGIQSSMNYGSEYITFKGGDGAEILTTPNTIDITKFKTLQFVYKGSIVKGNSTLCHVGVSSKAAKKSYSYPNDMEARVSLGVGSVSDWKVAVCDISALSGLYYISIGQYINEGSISLYIKEISLLPN